MLETAAVRRPGRSGDNLDIGRVLNAMLYYGRVHLIADSQFTSSLWAKLGTRGVKTLLSHPNVSTTVTPEFPGIQTNSNNRITTYQHIFGRYSGREGRIIATADIIGSVHGFLQNQFPDLKRSEVTQALSKAKLSSYSEILQQPGSRNPIFDSLVCDPQNLKLFLGSWAANEQLRINQSELDRLNIEVMNLGDSFLINTDRPLEKTVLIDVDVPFSWSQLLTTVQDYALELYLSQIYTADMISDPVVSHIADKRIDLSLRRSGLHQENVDAFERMAFDSAHDFGGAFNEGRLSLEDALRVVDQTERFRDWLRDLPPDASILEEYHRAVAKDTIVGTLPGSIVRFAFFTGAGIVADSWGAGGLGTLAGLSLSAVDNFIVDRVFRGWRPNLFVENVRKVTRRPD